MAITQYCQDNDERMPYAAWNGGTTLGNHWMDSTAPYLKSDQAWVCPSAMTAVARTTGSWPGWNGSGNIKAYYAWNESAQNNPALAGCGNPTLTYLILDRGNDMCFTSWFDWAGRAQNTWTGSSVPGPHLDGKNCGFVDGHVKWLKSDTIVCRDATVTPGLDTNSPYYGLFRN